MNPANVQSVMWFLHKFKRSLIGSIRNSNISSCTTTHLRILSLKMKLRTYSTLLWMEVLMQRAETRTYLPLILQRMHSMISSMLQLNQEPQNLQRQGQSLQISLSGSRTLWIGMLLKITSKIDFQVRTYQIHIFRISRKYLAYHQETSCNNVIWSNPMNWEEIILRLLFETLCRYWALKKTQIHWFHLNKTIWLFTQCH